MDSSDAEELRPKKSTKLLERVQEIQDKENDHEGDSARPDGGKAGDGGVVDREAEAIIQDDKGAKNDVPESKGQASL